MDLVFLPWLFSFSSVLSAPFLLPSLVNMSTDGEEQRASSAEHVPSGAASTMQHEEKVDEERAVVVRQISKVPGGANYFEKDGLPSYGDDQDHEHEPSVCHPDLDDVLCQPLPLTQETQPLQMTVHRFMSLAAMAFLWISGQIPAYLFGMSRSAPPS